MLVPSEGLLMRHIRFLSDHFLIILSTFCQNDFLANFPEKKPPPGVVKLFLRA
jgi:hypothetical protein